MEREVAVFLTGFLVVAGSIRCDCAARPNIIGEGTRYHQLNLISNSRSHAVMQSNACPNLTPKYKEFAIVQNVGILMCKGDSLALACSFELGCSLVRRDLSLLHGTEALIICTGGKTHA